MIDEEGAGEEEETKFIDDASSAMSQTDKVANQ